MAAITDVDQADGGLVSALKQNGESLSCQRVKWMRDNERVNISVG